MKHYLSSNIRNNLVFTCLVLTGGAAHAIVINEVDYDQPGADTSEFIELYNNSDISLSLDGYRLELVNGNNGSVYRNIDLTGFALNANSYFVVCDNATLVLNCDYDFTSSAGWIQNGAPDAVALLNGSTLIDAISYEGELLPYTGGSATTLADSNSIITSLSRIPDGMDSHNALIDFQLGCITPGSTNIVGDGDCSVQSVSAVPIPAAAWLFISGLIGVLGLVRRQKS